MHTYYSANKALLCSSYMPTASFILPNGLMSYKGSDQFTDQCVFELMIFSILSTNLNDIAIPDVQETEACCSTVSLSAR